MRIEVIAKALAGSMERAPWGWVLTIFVIATGVKGWPAIADAALRAKMALGDRRLSRIERLEARLEEQRVFYEAEIGLLSHNLGNVSACFDALILLLEAAPEQASEHVAKIKAMRDRQAAQHVVDKASIRAARLAAAGAAVAAIREMDE